MRDEIDIRPIAARLAEALTLADAKPWIHKPPTPDQECTFPQNRWAIQLFVRLPEHRALQSGGCPDA